MKKRAEAWLAQVYYGLLQLLGREALPESRKNRLRAVYPGEVPEQKARELDGKRLLQGTFCLAVFLALAAAAFLAAPAAQVQELPRPEGADAVQSYQLQVNGEDGAFLIEVPVYGRQIGGEEIEQRFGQAEAEARRQVLGENVSLTEIRHPLNFQTESSVAGMLVWWTPRDPELIGADGAILAQEIPQEGIETEVELHLYWEQGAEAEQRTVAVPLRLISESLPEETSLGTEAERLLRQAERENRESHVVQLPEQIQGKPVSFQFQNSRGPWELAGLGILAAVFLFAREEGRLREQYDRRNRQLLLDYSRLVENLSVLMGAGLPVRRAWERILREKEERGRSLYAEMALTLHAMEQGVPEEQAYGDFGRRCGLPPYLRLGSLLETNGRSGTKRLSSLLEQEAADAFQERLQLARRQGEEVSSRLLFPMLLLFALVLALLLIPAVLSL